MTDRTETQLIGEEVRSCSDKDVQVILFVNDKERCSGLFNLLNSEEQAIHVFNLGESNSTYSIEAKSKFGVEASQSSGLDGISLVSNVIDVIDPTAEILIDISILNKPALLYLLKEIEKLDALSNVRLFYSEPEEYVSNEFEVPSKGIQNIDSLPGFINSTPLNRGVLMILLLGYEPARSMAIYNNYDPDRTILISPHPPYNDEWEGRTEQKNSRLIKEVGEDHLYQLPSRKPEAFYDQFEALMDKENIVLNKWNSFVSPLSTKPQTVGVYLTWANFTRDFSIIHAEPIERNKLFVPKGIERTWELATVNHEY